MPLRCSQCESWEFDRQRCSQCGSLTKWDEPDQLSEYTQDGFGRDTMKQAEQRMEQWAENRVA